MTWRTFLKRPRRVALAVIATATAALTFHCPQREQVVITYRGAPEWVPEEYTLHQVLYPGRCVPLWSCDLPSRTPFGYWREPKRDTITATRRIGSRSTGTAFEINLARVLSLGAYRVRGMSLEAERPKEATGSRQTSPAKAGPEKRTKLPQRLFHILDFGTPSAFSIPLPVSLPGVEIVIDFDPIVYTRFEDLPDRDA